MMKLFRAFRFLRLAALSTSAMVSLGCSGSPGEEPAPGPTSRPVAGPLIQAPSRIDVAACKRELQPHLNRSTDDLRVFRGPDGRRRIDFQGRFGSGHVLRKEPDGTTRIQCVTSVAELEKFLADEGSRR